MPRILVVDDDADSRESIYKTLEGAGYEVLCANNGWEGLLVLDKQAADIVVVDVVMPGMDGSTFLRIVGNDIRHEKLPMIVISGFDRAEVFTKLSSIPVRPFVQ